MKVTICDPNTFENKEVEINDMQHEIAGRILQFLPEALKDMTPDGPHIIPPLTFTKLICQENGQVTMGIMFRTDLGEGGSKKFRITVEKIES